MRVVHRTRSSPRARVLGDQPFDELTRRQRARATEALSRPQMECVGITAFGGGAPQRAGQIVDVWIRARRVTVLAYEPIQNPACAPAGERSGQRRDLRRRIRERSAMRRAGTGFGTTQER